MPNARRNPASAVDSAAVSPQQSRQLGWLIGVLVACVVSAQAGTSAVNVALPELAEWSGGGFGFAQWAVVVYLLAMTGASLVVGYLADILGRTRVLKYGLVLFVGAAIACALAPSMWVLVLARALQGIGAAAMAALPLAIARDRVATNRAGSIMGLLGTAAAIGTAGGPAVGGLLQGTSGWPAIFWAMVPLPLIALVILGRVTKLADKSLARVRRSGPEAAVGPRRGFDVSGGLIVAAAATAYAIAFTGEVFGSWWSLGLMVVAGLLVTILVPVERRAAQPLLPGSLLRERVVSLGAGLNLIVGAVMISTLVVGPFYLAGALGLSPTAVGFAMAAGPAVSVFSGVLSGRLVDRNTPENLVSVGLGVMVVGAGALAVLPPLWGLPGYLTGTMLLAPGYQLFLAANNTLVMGQVAVERRGTASGLLGLSRNLGLITGSSVLGSIFAAVISAADSGASTESLLDGGLRLIFGIAVLALGVATCTSLLLRKRG